MKKIITYTILGLIILFNFYLYRSEFKVKIDPNDNVFQYALVDEAKNIWQQVFSLKLSPLYLLDSVNERWAEGFALSQYYAHLPQAVISLISLISHIGTYSLFMVIRTLVLIFMPLMFFWGARVLGFSGIASLLVALFSQLINTDGLYGIDASSYLWRGWGLSSQLLAQFFLPVAFAYAVDYLKNKTNLVKAIFFNFLVAQSHLGVFLLVLLAYPIVSLTILVGQIGQIRQIGGRLLIFLGLTLLTLSYFFGPFFLNSQYRNFSFWDPLWKFNSWGAKQITIWFSQGDMFDFGRLPFLTLAVAFGVIWGIGKINFFSFLFVFYFLLFFGRTTLGRLIDLIPGFSEYHLHRIIFMVQFTGIFIAAEFLYIQSIKILSRVNSSRKIFISFILLIVGVVSLLTFFYLEKPVIQYAKLNGEFIERANKAYDQDFPDYKKITDALRTLPRARVYAGKPGNWGRNFFLAETPVYMALSQDGFPVIGFLPESWSPNSDPEQFFDDADGRFYNLYNVKYLVLPQNIPAPSFAKLHLDTGKYRLYTVKTGGWFDTGASTIAIISKKTDLINVTRLWFGSNFFKKNNFARISLNKDLSYDGKWHIKMSDLNHFINLNDEKERNIWQANPFSTDFKTSKTKMEISDEKAMPAGYSVNLKIPQNCQNCLVVLKESFHPDWEVKINGNTVETYPIFPFYIGIPIEKPGQYQLVATYKPDKLKAILLFSEIGGLILAWFWLRRR